LRFPIIKKETAIPSVVEQNPAVGTWYWRVLPVFPSLYQGSSAYSDTASFRIEQGSGVVPPEPESEIIAVLPPPPPPRPVQRPIQQPVARQMEQQPTLQPEQQPEQQPVVLQQPKPQLLKEPGNRRPAGGQRFEYIDLQKSRKIDFSWAPVANANRYIVTLYYESAGGRRQIIRTNPLPNMRWTFSNLSLLERGTFVWEVEAVRVNSNGVIEQRGTPVESIFIVDVPPGQVRIDDIGTLYGN
jgi:hypothetical protein